MIEHMINYPLQFSHISIFLSFLTYLYMFPFFVTFYINNHMNYNLDILNVYHVQPIYALTKLCSSLSLICFILNKIMIEMDN